MRGRSYNLLNKQISKVLKSLSNLLFWIPPIYIFTGLILLTLLWASFLPSLKFNYDIERFFSSKDTEVRFYYAHRKTFENENDFVLIGLKTYNGIFEKDFLKKTDSLTKVLKRFDRINKVFSPTSLYEAVKTPLGSIRIPLIHTYELDKYVSDKNKIYASGVYTNAFFSPDTQSVSLLIRKDNELSKQDNDSLLLALSQTINSFGFDEFHIAGRIQTQHYYVGHMKKQMGLFAGLACLLFLISLSVIFRNIRYVFLSFTAVIFSLIWIFGFIGWLGIQLDLMLTLLPALIFIISTSGSIHLITRFTYEFHDDIHKQGAIKKAVAKTGMPNFLNAFTTAIGFSSLIMIPVPPIQQFGLLVALGIIFSFLVNLIMIPTALRIMTLKHSSNLVNIRYSWFGVFYFTMKRPSWVFGAFALIILASIYYSFQVKVNNHFLDDLNPSSSLKKDLDFFEQNFSGIRPFEMNIQSKNKTSILSFDALRELDTVENYIKSEYGVGFLFSPLTIIKSINKALNSGNQKYYQLPKSQQELGEIIKLADNQRIWKRFLSVLNSDFTIGRITGRTKDEGSQVFWQRNEMLQQFLKKNTHQLQFNVTGAAHLMDNANNILAINLTKGILVAILVATIIIGLFTASWRLALISLIPNILPLLLVAGLMGAVGIPLKVATSLIFTIAYGIAVDDTIHFLNGYRLNKKRLLDNNEAIRETIATMWRPMLYTSIVLFFGFMIFTLSEFSSISLLGYLISVSLLMALLADLVLLPLILHKSYPSN